MVCIVCGLSLPRRGQGRRRLYCSDACRQRAFRQREDERLWRGSDLEPAHVDDVTTILNAALKPPPRR